MSELVVRTPAEARVVAALVTHALDLLEVGGETRALALGVRARARRAAATGEGLTCPTSASGSDGGAPGEDLVGTTTAAVLLGVTPRSVRQRCRAGRIPGAIQTARGEWLIPSAALPHEDEEP